jgi:DNA-binding ferritin-like protein (Dps family)
LKLNWKILHNHLSNIESKNLDPRLIKEIFSNSVDKIIKALPNDTYTNFFDEKQKDSVRVLHFENEKTAAS